MQLILFSLYLQGIFMVPSCLIIELPYAERTASFFSSVSGLGFPLLLNFSEGIMQSSLIGKTLLCVPVSTLLWGLIFCFLSGWVISSVAKASSHVLCIECCVSSMALTLMVLIVRISSSSLSPCPWCVNHFLEDWLWSLVELFPFASPADRLPVISFATFFNMTYCKLDICSLGVVFCSCYRIPFLFLYEWHQYSCPLDSLYYFLLVFSCVYLLPCSSLQSQ